MPKLLIFLFVILIPAQTSAQDGSVESLLARVIAAHGGAENLQKTRFAVQSGKIFSHRRGETVGRVTRTLGGPENFLIEISYPEEPTEIRLLAGAKALRDGAEASGPLAEEPIEAEIKIDDFFKVDLRVAEIEVEAVGLVGLL